MHLLACLLARAWDAKAAISIWRELVLEKKERVQRSQRDGTRIFNPLSMAAANSDISRDDLARWDASARAWLRKADESMMLQHTQFALIVDNLELPFPSGGGSTFDRVVLVWTQSMEVLEKLLLAHPQSAYDRAVPLAISSWHLYPNLLVFQ